MSSPSIWTKTFASRSPIERQVPRSDSLRKPLSGAQPAQVRLVGIQGSRKALDEAKRAQDPQQVLQRDAAVGVLQPPQSVDGDAGAVGELRPRQAGQLAPGHDVFAYLAQGAADPGWAPALLLTIRNLIIHI